MYDTEGADRKPAVAQRGKFALSLVAALLSATFPLIARAAFPDAHDLPPGGWTGPVFKLSQAYPEALPAAPQNEHPWTAFDFRKPAEAPRYLKAVLDYCLAGNTSADPDDNFRDVSQNPVRKWYHAPWLHDGPKGREFIHGLTKERRSKVGELGPSQTSEHDNWAVGFYNPRGGHVLGRVWKNPAKPNPTRARFPLHTVSCKFLFTTAPLSEVPFLGGTLVWQADINRASGPQARPEVRLLQVDVGIRVASTLAPNGWVFGTFQYEKGASSSTNWWEHLVPVGLMWGNDPDKVSAGQASTKQWINLARGQMLHLGYKDLVLNGPIDNPNASCMACHGFAQINKGSNPAPAIPGIPNPNRVPPPTPEQLKSYFRDIKAGQALSADYVSVDYSLQLQAGIANAINAGEATLPESLSRSLGARGAAPAAAARIVKVERDAE